MKLLIGYDGSRVAEAALDDLQQAGLPDEGEAAILSVAEVWLPPQNAEQAVETTGFDSYTKAQLRTHWEKGEKLVSEAEAFARHAKDRLQNNFPLWRIKAEATYGSPAWEILTKAAEYKPDLIVVGSHGHSAIVRAWLGSISQKVLTEARCSVRIARGKVEVDPYPSRIIIGFDGSQGAQAAVDAVASRFWREESEVRLIAVTDPVIPSAIGRFVPPIVNWVEEVNSGEREWLEKLAESSLIKLEKAGLKASLMIAAGNPKKVLVEEAENWHADSIFVGANAFGSAFEKFLLGSVSAAVAARATCSVEVVRKQTESVGSKIEMNNISNNGRGK